MRRSGATIPTKLKATKSGDPASMRPDDSRCFRKIALLRIGAVAWCLAGLVALPALGGDTRPNFVVISIDDLGYADIGPYGSRYKTPNLDRMAAEGRKLTSHYAAPVCTPSRAALLTGCYPKRALPIPHVLFPAAAVGLHPDERTIAEVLKEAGYATACIGKWHLGDQKEFLPTRQGFDEYFGLPYSNDMGPAADGARSNPGEPLPAPAKVPPGRGKPGKPAADETGLRGAAQPPLPLLENDKVIGRVRVAEQFALTGLYTERAVQFLHKHRDEPFFLYLPHGAVHFPHYPSRAKQGHPAGSLLGNWVEDVDMSVGRVLEELRNLKLAEKTLVLFTSDNGGALNRGASNAPLRGGKGETFEGGIRVCTIAWWPGKIPAGTSTSAMTSMMDVLPTLAKLAGAKLPADRTLDGVDIWPVLVGLEGPPPRDRFFYFRGLTLEAVRSGPWKLHLALAEKSAGGKAAKARPQLFHLEDDVGETRDLADANPQRVAELQRLAQSIEGDLGLTAIGPGCRPLGRVSNPEPLLDHEGTVRADAVGAMSRFP
jgi:arylsulfatase A-like enzyme